MNICAKSQTVLGKWVAEPETAEIRGPYHTSQVCNIIKSQKPLKGDNGDQEPTCRHVSSFIHRTCHSWQSTFVAIQMYVKDNRDICNCVYGYWTGLLHAEIPDSLTMRSVDMMANFNSQRWNSYAILHCESAAVLHSKDENWSYHWRFRFALVQFLFSSIWAPWQSSATFASVILFGSSQPKNRVRVQCVLFEFGSIPISYHAARSKINAASLQRLDIAGWATRKAWEKPAPLISKGNLFRYKAKLE